MSLPIVLQPFSCNRCTYKSRIWCNSCAKSDLKEKFTEWTSGNNEIDDFIKEQQLKITFEACVFEWIPYNKLNIIEKSGKHNYPIAIWNEGPLKFNENTRRHERIHKENVILIYINNSENIINEFSNEIKKYSLLPESKIHGISQNLNTKDYILIIKNEYCEKCDRKYSCVRHNWCHLCQRDYLKNLGGWNSSGNQEVNDFIETVRPNVKMDGYNAPIFEWIPYDQFSNIKKIGKKAIANLAVWNNGPLLYDFNGKKEWVRELNKKVCLINYYDITVFTYEFAIREIMGSIYLREVYGMSQDPHTKNYILIFQDDYCEPYCKICGEKKDTILCNPCIINELENNFTKWASGNEKIDNFIKNKQLQIKDYHDEVIEWISYDKFSEIKRKDDFAIAIWKNGPLKFDADSERKSKKVILKYSYSLQSITDEELYSTENSYGISQDPDTKDYIMVLQSKYYCKECGKRYPNTNKWCNPCQLNYLMKNFTNWNSGNESINNLIRETQLKIVDCNDVMLTWIPYDQFKSIKKIGTGGFSTVYEATWEKKNCKHVALKCVYNSQNAKDAFLNEVKVHSKLCQLLQPKFIHDGDIRLLEIYGISQDPNTKDYIIILEYINGGSFYNWIVKNREFNWQDKVKILKNIISGLDNIHRNHMVHCDFHTGNILIEFDYNYYDANQKLVISDMGLCGEVGNIDETNIYGVIPYMASEVLRGNPYTQAADIYSFGMIMYFVATAKQPFAGCNHDQNLILDICEGVRPKINELEAPQCYIDLMNRCLDLNPDNRPNTTELFKMFHLFWESIVAIEAVERDLNIKRQFNEADAYRKKIFMLIIMRAINQLIHRIHRLIVIHLA